MILHLMYSVPKCGSIRLKMASAVEGCLYKRLKVVPGRPSRYSNDRREDADIWSEAYLFVTSMLLRYLSIIAEAGLETIDSGENFPIATLRSDQSPNFLCGSLYYRLYRFESS